MLLLCSPGLWVRPQSWREIGRQGKRKGLLSLLFSCSCCYCVSHRLVLVVTYFTSQVFLFNSTLSVSSLGTESLAMGVLQPLSRQCHPGSISSSKFLLLAPRVPLVSSLGNSKNSYLPFLLQGLCLTPFITSVLPPSLLGFSVPPIPFF